MLTTFRSAKFVIHCCNEGFEGRRGLESILWQEGGGLVGDRYRSALAHHLELNMMRYLLRCSSLTQIGNQN
jgi:hypothetical protein